MWKWESEGKAIAVVAIIHSAYEHHLKYAWLIERLRSNNFHVVMGDLPGHGEVAKQGKAHDEKFEDFTNYIHTVLKIAVEDELPVFIFGHGLGASLLIQQLQKKSIACAGVILTSPWFQLKITVSKLSNALSSIGKIAETMKLKSDHGITIKQLTRNYEIYMEEKDDPYFHSKITIHWYYQLMQLLKSIQTSTELIHPLPVLMMTGEDDRVTDTVYAKQWLIRQNLPEFQWKEWQDGFHDLYHEPEREEVFLYTFAFMKNVLRSLGYIIEE